MTVSELNDWIEYYSQEPWGSVVSGKRHALTTSVIANVAQSLSSKRQKPFKLQDFEIGCTSKKQTSEPKKRPWQEVKSMFDAFCPKGS